MPRISIAPRLAEMNARPVIQAVRERPESKKSSLVAMALLARIPIATTKAK
jgi:hypothetical protein